MESPLPQITASVCGLAELIIKVQFALTTEKTSLGESPLFLQTQGP